MDTIVSVIETLGFIFIVENKVNSECNLVDLFDNAPK